MNINVKRSLALLLALVLCIGLLPATQIVADAADFEYVYDSTGKYIYNWGTRGETATSLSPNAEAFYTSTSYDALSQKTGGTGTSDAPSSALYAALQSLMVNNHSYQTSYEATKTLYQYTDCQNSGKDTKEMSSFYSGDPIGPAWDGGSTWNREHTWPNSKGDAAGNGENDIMMLRPTASSENGSRGNKAYGEDTGAGYYDPNSVSGGTYNLRGDVARIILYVYVRWGCTNTGAKYNPDDIFGTAGVFESLDVLLDWMEEDPVDTWEMGRNDSVQSITGTRNVFVDYPEFAFLLFGAEIPTDMTTPSGEAKNADTCDHNYVAGTTVAPTCTEEGYTVYTCTLCSKSYKGDKVPATGHNYVDGKCTACQADEVLVPVVVTEASTNTAYKLGLHSLAKDSNFYFTGKMSGYYGQTDATYDNGVDVYLEEAAGGYYLYFMDENSAKQYISLVASGEHLNFTFATTANSVFTWDTEKAALYTTVGSETCYMGTYGDYVTVGVLQGSKLQATDYIAQLYTLGSGSGEGVCQHNYVPTVTAPTCTEDGYTTYTCTLCNRSYIGNKVSATGHSYENGTCTSCGEPAPAGNYATISFADKANRTSYSTSKQVWEQNGITVTNEKGSSTSNVGDYANPARFYKSSTLTIAYPSMTKIEVACNTADYATALKSAITTGTATVSGKIVTIVLPAAADTYTTVLSAGQVRVDSITVYAEDTGSGDTGCQHTSTQVLPAVPATCTETGLTEGSKCADCGEVLNPQTEIPALGHNYVNGTCTRCGQAQPSLPANSWTKIDLADITDSDIIAITMTKGSTTWALYNANGTGSAPTAVVVTVNGDVMTCDDVETLSWNISNTNGQLIIYVAGTTSKWLYSTNTNNGTRVGTNTNKTWILDASSGYLKHEGTNRYLGVYIDKPDWRSYSNTTGNTAGQTLSFWKLNTDSGETPACQHTNTKTEGALAATCTGAGHTGKTVCADCGETISVGEEIPALGHDETHHSAKAPTCTEPGWDAYVTCSRCDYTTYAEKPATGHDYDTVVTAPTCTATGYTTYTCSVCEDSKVADMVPALGHDHQPQVIAPTCTEPGYTLHKCSRCEDSYTTNPVEALGHTEVSDPAVAPTCVDTGLTAGIHCGVCGEVLVAQTEVPATGEHTYDNGVCTGCGRAEPACSHINTQVLPGTAPTCTEPGWTDGEKCSDCGEVLTAQEEIPALGHDYVGGCQVDLVPTEKTEGHLTGACVVCSQPVEATLPALNMVVYTFTVVTAPADGNAGTGCFTWNETAYGEFSFEVEFRYGDANGDGVVNGQDVVLLRKFMANYNYDTQTFTEIVFAGADANGDGKINGQDVVLLRRYMANYDYDTGISTVPLGPQD